MEFKFKFNYQNFVLATKIFTCVVLFSLIYCIRNIYKTSKNFFNYNLYIIQDEIEKNKYEDVLIGTNSHVSIFELADNNFNKKDINAINLYTGLCFSKIEMYKESLYYLLKVKTKEPLIDTLLKRLIGDCYTELKDYDNAVKYFNESINVKNSSPKININTVYKLALIYEEKKDYKKTQELLSTYIKKYTNEKDISILKNEKKKVDLILKSLNTEK